MTDLGTLGGSGSTARVLNNVGQIAGDSFTASGDRHAVLWRTATPQELVGPIVDLVNGLVDAGKLKENLATALITLASSAEDHLETENLCGAIRLLQAFINVVNARLNDGSLSPEDGQLLIDAANNSISLLSGPC